jgi:superfamily II DNA/RNA helicase
VPNSTARRNARASKPHHHKHTEQPRAYRDAKARHTTDRRDGRWADTHEQGDRAVSDFRGRQGGRASDNGRGGFRKDDRRGYGDRRTSRDDRQGNRDTRGGDFGNRDFGDRAGYRDSRGGDSRGGDFRDRDSRDRRDSGNRSDFRNRNDRGSQGRGRDGFRRKDDVRGDGRRDGHRGQDFRSREDSRGGDTFRRTDSRNHAGSRNRDDRGGRGRDFQGRDFRNREDRNREDRPTFRDRAADRTPDRSASHTATHTANHAPGQATERTAPRWTGEISESGPSRGSVSFAELGLPTPLLRALEDAGITAPFAIQAATLPDALGGRDVLGRAQTGSGKTLAFGLALLTRLHKGSARSRRPRGLVLVPTRELAMQVADALTPLAKSLGLWCRTVVGGLSFSRQVDQLERGIDLLIATPGRLSDHVRQGTCVLDDVRFVALDEADQMADMGFLPQVREILDLVPDGQRMLFSATLDRDVSALVDRYLTDPVTHSVSPATASVSTMDHHLLLVSREDKAGVVAEMAARDGRTILFLRTKHHVDRLTRQLREMGVRAGALHGGKPQGARNRVLGEFKDGSLPVLVATDVAARGIHVDGVSLVVHVDPPADAKGYLHRAGRTARAGETGTVVTVVTHQERRTVFRMTEQAGVSPERTKVRPGDADLVRITGARVPSGEPVVDPEPTRRPGGRFNRPGRGARRPAPRRAR